MYRSDAPRLKFASATVKLSMFSALVLMLGLFVGGMARVTGFNALALAAKYILAASVALILLTVVLAVKMPDRYRIRNMVRRSLFCPAYGNPLHFKDGERLPAVRCKRVGLGRYELTITAVSCTVDDLVNISSNLSSGLNRKFERYAVTAIDTDVAFRFVKYSLEDVTVDRSIVAHSVDELCQGSVMCSRFLGIFICIPKSTTHHYFVTLKEHIRFFRMCSFSVRIS